LPAAIVMAAALIATLTTPVRADSDRCVLEQRGSPSLVQIQAACPVLGAIIEGFALRDLGEAFPDETPSSHIVPAAALAGDDAALARLARQARENGATMHDFDEALYLTAVGPGIPKAIEATRVLLDVFGARETDRAPCRTSS
jgi:hypothetical protein